MSWLFILLVLFFSCSSASLEVQLQDQINLWNNKLSLSIERLPDNIGKECENKIVILDKKVIEFNKIYSKVSLENEQELKLLLKGITFINKKAMKILKGCAI